MKMLTLLGLKGLEKALNHVLAQDEEKAKLLTPYVGQTIEVIVLPLKKPYYISVQAPHQFVFELTLSSTKTPTISVEGAPLALGRAWQSDSYTSDVHIKGDVSALQSIRRIVKTLLKEMDKTALMAQYVGEMPAQWLSNICQQGKNYYDYFTESLTEQCQAFLQEEAQFFPSSEEINLFCQEVDLIRHEVERLQARLHYYTTHKAS